MFKFQANWPQWVPWLGGTEVFPAIWNLADACITVGVAMVFLRQRRYFPKPAKAEAMVSETAEEASSEEE
jgi:signal peptidase II